MSELSILKHLCNKEFYDEHRQRIKAEYLSKELRPLLTIIDGYYNRTDNPVSLSVDDLSNLHFATNRHKVDLYEGIFDALRANGSSKDSTVSLLAGLSRTALLRELSLSAYDAAEGRKPLTEVLKLTEGLSTTDEENIDEDQISYVSDDLVDLLDTSHSLAGNRWRLDSLNKTLGSLRKGDFGFIFARPETGKTTFLASEVSYMAEHATQPVLWINNEEQSNKVMLRCYQSALELTLEELLIDPSRYRGQFQERLQGRVRIYDAPGASFKQIEKLVDKVKPSLIVFDQIDKIKGFENDREDLRLGSIYIWARELAKAHAPVIGVCQADGSGEGVRWLTMGNVANAKTSKQAEADWILGIGKISDTGYDNLRFMHLSKNKLLGDTDTDPTRRHDRWEVVLDAQRARYRDL